MTTDDSFSIHRRLDEAFAPFPMSPGLQDLKEELRGNLAARVGELVAQGAEPDEAARTAVAELGDLRALIEQVQAGDDTLANRQAAYQLYRVRPRAAFVVRTVLLALVLTVAAAIVALAALGVLDLQLPIAVAVAVVAFALPGGVITADALRQETSVHYPVPAPRAAYYGAASASGLAGLALGGLYAGQTQQLPLVVAAAVLVVASIVLFVALGATQTNRTKAWVSEAWRENPVEDRFTRDPMAAARFGIYALVLWVLAAVAFVVLSMTVGFAWSWLAIVAGFVAFMLLIAAILFGPDAESSGRGKAGRD
jgi:hypothetical protein